MMRGVSTWAVAVRTPGPRSPRTAGEIEVTSEPLVSWAKRHRLLRLPVIRGVVALGESLKIGFRALAISANAQLGRGGRSEEPQPIGGFTWGLTIAFSLVLAIGLFFVVPVGRHEPDQGPARLARSCSGSSRGSCGPRSSSATSPRSAGCRTCGGCSSTTAPSTRRSPATRPATALVPERAERYSRLHPRCGTSFLLIVMVLAIFVFAPIGLPAWYWLVASRDPRDPADRRPLLRGHQVGGQQPPQGLGARGDVARADAPEPHHPRARPRPARGRDRRARGRAGGREPRAGRAATPSAIEIVA